MNTNDSIIQRAGLGLRSFKTLSSIAALALALAGTAHAALGIVSYNLLSASPTTTALNASASAIGTGAGITTANYNVTVPSRLFLAGNAPDATAATAVSLGNYFSFTVTPSAGYALNLSSLSFNEAITPGGGLSGYDVRTSVDGFASDVQSAGGIASSSAVSVGMSGAGYQGLTSALTVRIYAFNSAATLPPSFSLAAFNSVILGGTVTSVPEPTTLALIGVGGMALLGLRRRRA